MSYEPKILERRYVVGLGGEFTTIKEAVDWFNASGVGNSQLFLDGGVHEVDDTITINSTGGYYLEIKGIGTDLTYVVATGGLDGKPMFNIITSCDFRAMYIVGGNVSLGGLNGYGGAGDTGENCFDFATTTDLYCEITDVFIDTFFVAVNDTIGTNFFVFNFVILTCQTGILVNYTTNSPTTKIFLDVETGNLEHCPVGIDLIKTGADKKSNFYLSHLIFKHNNANNIGIQYAGGTGNYIYGEIAEIIACTYNGTGDLASGFDFSLSSGRDANIRFIANTGEEDSKPHAKITVYGNSQDTTASSSGVFYKAVFTNGSTYTKKMTIEDNKMTYQSSIVRDGMMWLSGAISTNGTNKTLGVCIRREVPITSLIGGAAVATIVTPDEHHMTSGQQIQVLGCASATYNGIKTITVVDDYTFTYPNTTNAGDVTGSTTCGNMMGIISVRTTTANVAVNFSTNCYVEDMLQNGYSEIYVMGTGDTIKLVDVSWLFNTI